MTNYYFVGSLLPELRIGFPVEMNFAEFDRLLQMNLSKHDYEKTKILRRFWDIENLRSYWKKEPLDSRGNLNENEIEDAILETEALPPYIRNYLEKHADTPDRLTYFPALLSAYFKEEIKHADGFLKWLLEFQRELRLVLVAFRAKKLGRNLEAELQFEDPEDPFIIQLLAYKDAPVFEPPEKYEDVKALFTERADAPLALHQALCEYIFYTIDKKVGLHPFTIDRILGYLVQLSLAEKWLELDKAKGVEIVDRFVKEKA
jgi:hypothetical protein